MKKIMCLYLLISICIIIYPFNTVSDPNSINTDSLNLPPDPPINPIPENGSENIELNPRLSVYVSDADTPILDVSFYNADDNNEIGVDRVVSSGSRASVIWSDLITGTNYSWYTVVSDDVSETSSEIWSFSTTGESPNNPPYEPSNPNPSNGSQNIDFNVDLSWQGGDPDGDIVSYDVYFESVYPPGKSISNQSETSYDPGLLNYNTKYYWKIISWDEKGLSAVGPLWNFTTQEFVNRPPDEPSVPSPVDGSIDINLNPTLSVYVHDPNDDPLNVYFYNSSDNSLIGMVSNVESGRRASVTYSDLSYGKIYYWYAIANDSLLENKSSTWFFSTADNFDFKITFKSGLGIKTIIKNNGNLDITELNWELKCKSLNNLINRVSIEKNGVISNFKSGGTVLIRELVDFNFCIITLEFNICYKDIYNCSKSSNGIIIGFRNIIF